MSDIERRLEALLPLADLLYVDATKTGNVVHAAPHLTLMADLTSGLIVSWRPIGMPFLTREQISGADWKDLPVRERPLTGWRLAIRTWEHNHVLHVRRLKDWHSVWLMYDNTFQFVSWYVNFEKPAAVWPLRGSGMAVLTNDLSLDLRLGRGHRGFWKDVSEFAEYTAAGGHWEIDTAIKVARDAANICPRISSASFPFSEFDVTLPSGLARTWQSSGSQSTAGISRIRAMLARHMGERL